MKEDIIIVKKNKFIANKITGYFKQLLELNKNLKEISIVIVKNNNMNSGFTVTRKNKQKW